tara:strand:- start:202 stop:522 length:321 start_codon:yes stop_codon:yes gene_type:complete
MTKFNLYLIIFSILLTSCQSIKDGLSGNKTENSDEFLVKKKNPLVTPPNYMELPVPEDEKINDEISKLEEESNLGNILSIENTKIKTTNVNNGSAEDFVLKQIKKK